MEIIRYFKDIRKEDVQIAGGKGASLGEMINSGIFIPKGFVILSSAFEKFLEETDLDVEIDSILHKVKHDDINTVEKASEQIKALILNSKMPKLIGNEINKHFKKLGSKYVAVRSSATSEDSSTAAWAGQLETYLNTNKKSLLENVKKCWASLFTPRAIFYRFEKDLHKQKISVAVVVQKMVESEKSGISFSVHPVTQDKNQLIIEAGFGLGEAIVSGQITPDSYVVEKEPRRIIDKNVVNQEKGLYRSNKGGNEWRELGEKGKKQVLNDKEIFKLSELILKIENHYGFPVDVEWAFENGNFYIVQSRPITTLSDKRQEKKDPLILLGAWNVMPLEAWRWFNTVAIEKLRKLTGIKIRVFTYVEEDLHYQCVFENEVSELRRRFEKSKSEKERVDYVSKIYDDFYKEVPKLEKYLDKVEGKDFSKFSNREIIEAIKNFADLWTAITTQIWYAVFLDIWYPLPQEHKAAKEVAAKARDKTGHLHERSNLTERKLYAEVAKRLGVDVNFLFPAEIVDTLSNGISYTDEIKKRKQFCVTASVEGTYKIYSGAKAKELFEKYRPPSVGTEAKRELQGAPACNGRVSGVVRVIRRDKDFDQFKNGEILVALQTMVHYLPIMKKAKAILTEFGGLTSHAAIVSRELNKPCIVGIPNLLASVQDGDKVEVDADRGIVNILNRTVKKSTLSNDNNLSTKQKIEKIFSRDFSLITLQMDYLPESSQTRPWTNERNPFQPYLIFWRNEGTSKIYFNVKGVGWIKEQLKKQVNRNKDFLKKVEKKVREGIKYIRPIYEKKKILNKKDLIRFVNEFIDSYHWIEAMWWIKSMASEELKEIDCSNIVKLREETEELSAASDIVIRRSLANLYPELDNLSAMISIEELRGDTKIDIETLKKRDKGFVLIDNKIILDKTFHEVLNEKNLILEEEVIDPTVTVLKGERVSNGKYRGRIVRVMGHNDFGKFRQGDILLSPMTMVDFLPIMKKAGAFITDEGGVLCHAAIVARELNKPCVVGTIFATRILKDGDEVEVDADNGIIRILKEKKQYFEELIHLDFPLIVAELTNYGETIEDIPWSKKKFKFKPYCIFVRKNNSLYYYYDKGGIKWKIEEAGKFDKKIMIENISKSYNELKDIIEKEKSLDKQGFKKFIDKLKRCWTWFDCMWWMIEYYDQNNFDKEDLLEVRKKTQHFAQGIAAVIRNSIKKIYPKQKKYADVLLLNEVLNNEIPKEKILNKRLQGYAYTNSKLYDSIEKIKNEFDIEIEVQELYTGELKGQTAYPGKVEGIVKIFERREDIKNFKEGEILVASTTTPDFLPAMKKASAIISEHGGAISHAAITSRELKIPCIVGVKGATQVLKDGMEVEVDANRGIIKIIDFLVNSRNQQI